MNSSMIPFLLLNNKNLPSERKMFYMMLGQSMSKSSGGSAMLPILMAQQEGADLVARQQQIAGLQSKVKDMGDIIDIVIDEDLTDLSVSDDVKTALRNKFKSRLGLPSDENQSASVNQEELFNTIIETNLNQKQSWFDLSLKVKDLVKPKIQELINDKEGDELLEVWNNLDVDSLEGAFVEIFKEHQDEVVEVITKTLKNASKLAIVNLNFQSISEDDKVTLSNRIYKNLYVQKLKSLKKLDFFSKETISAGNSSRRPGKTVKKVAKSRKTQKA